MKYLAKLGCAIALLASCVSMSMADVYSGILSTYTITGSTVAWATVYPQIRGGALIDKLVFVATQPIGAPILISAYNESDSTTNATMSNMPYFIMLGTGSGGATYNTESNRLTVDFPPHNPLKVNNISFIKADGNTSTTVYCTIIYR